MDAIQLLTHDHREVESLFEKFSTGSTEQRREIAQSVIRELSRHDAVEVMHLYPAVRGLGTEGEKLTEHSIGEHHEVRDLLQDLDRDIDSVDSPDYEATWNKLVAAIKDHVEEEEGQIFPLLEQHTSEAERDEMGTAIEKAKETAPTRPHPTTPDNPTAASVMGRAAGVLDRARDAASGRSEG